jgi:hypothetical protein
MIVRLLWASTAPDMVACCLKRGVIVRIQMAYRSCIYTGQATICVLAMHAQPRSL